MGIGFSMTYIIYILLLLILVFAFSVTIKRHHYVKRAGTCLYIRKFLLKKQPKTEGEYIPQCTLFGRYFRQQCNESTNECWCVTVDGKKIVGTAVMGRQPAMCHLNWFSQFYRQMQ